MTRKISLATAVSSTAKALSKAGKVRPPKGAKPKAKAPAKAPKAPKAPVMADPSNHLNTDFQRRVLDALRGAKALKAPATAKALAALSVSFADFIKAGGPQSVLGYAGSFALSGDKLTFTAHGAKRYRDKTVDPSY